jgi:hypothetical protein
LIIRTLHTRSRAFVCCTRLREKNVKSSVIGSYNEGTRSIFDSAKSRFDFGTAL